MTEEEQEAVAGAAHQAVVQAEADAARPKAAVGGDR
jgi:hypothetical protein